jgi:hypothetical protein
MEAGQTIMIYTEPLTINKPDNWATLIELIEDCGVCEYWTFEFVDYPGKIYKGLIKKI